MKIHTHITVRVPGKDKDRKHAYLAPGEHDLDDKIAADLLKRGHAKTPAKVAKEAAAAKGEAPSVTKGDKAKGGK